MPVKSLRHVRVAFIIMGSLLVLAACVSPRPTPEITPPPPGTSTPAASPTATSTPLPTMTPTPTAPPLVVSDYLRSTRLTTPVPQRGAPCGVVDLFDFPLDPPDANNATARWPFGRYSDRYQGIHTGEDWVYDTGGSFGQPVYSIGHGMVLYAEPLGWGVDQGTIVIRHVLPGGSTILSFYGHLEPDSVVLHPGACVTRGEQIGRIGKPRGQPHLHFEIRTIFPDQPGPGYWPVDPTLAGWKPPTEYIWDERVSTSPGVKWTRPFTSVQSTLIGLLISDTIAAIDNDQLIGLDTGTGHVRWSRPVSNTIRSAQVDETGSAIYLLTITGTLEAVDAAGETQWQLARSPAAQSILLPQPGSGVMLYDGQALTSISASGVERWHVAQASPPADWSISGDRLFFSTDADPPALYQLDPVGQLQLLPVPGGRVTTSRDHLFAYSPTAIYRLSETPTLLKLLDRQTYNDGSLVTAWDGTVVVSHHGVIDRRLLAFNPDGTLRWEKSIAALTVQAPELVAVGRRVYAVTTEGDVWWIDPQSGDTQRVLDGQRLNPLPGRIHVLATNLGTLIIDYRGGRLIALDPRRAITSYEQADAPGRITP